MKWTFFSAMALGFTLLPLGCTEDSGEGNPSELTETSEALSPSNKEDGKHRKHRKYEKYDGKEKGRHGRQGRRGFKRRDPSRILFQTALNQASLSAEQEEKIKSIMAEKRAFQKEGKERNSVDFRKIIAKNIRTGKLDIDEMKAHFEKREAKLKARRTEKAKAINELYAVLDASQRQSVVAEITAKQNRIREENGIHEYGKEFGKGKKSKRFGRDDDGSPSHSFSKKRDGKWGMKKGTHHFARDVRGNGLLKQIQGLELSEDQLAQIETVKKTFATNRHNKEQYKEKRTAMKQCHGKFLESFASDNFDATAMQCPKASEKDRQAKLEQRIANDSALLQILTEEQRNQLADQMENASRIRR